MIPKCLNCQTNPAQYKLPYGWLLCSTCLKRQKSFKAPTPAIEITTEGIKTDRKAYKKDILQRYRGGTPSLEYINQYGTKGFTREEIKQARNTNEEEYYRDKEDRYHENTSNKPRQ